MAIQPGQWDVAQQLFEGALQCKPDERAAYLERGCPDDPALRRDLLQMIALHEGDPAFLETPVVVHLLTAPLLVDGEVLAGRFRILRRLGAGGMGEVYEAEDLVDRDRPERVALKIVRPGLAPLEDVAARLRREIQLAHKVSHSNVCKVHSLYLDRRPAGDRLFLIMDFLDGVTLRERLRDSGPLAPREALSIAAQIAAGLDEAHRERVIHKDLKSSNIMLVPRKDGTTRAVITDFSIAASEEEQFKLGTGTDAYMAPERMVDAGATTAADIYSFGVVLYEMVTGALPFGPGTSLERRRELPPAPGIIRRGLSRKWNRAILRCLHPDSRQRFTRASDAVDAVRPRRWVPAAATLLAVAAGAALAGPVRDWALARAPTSTLSILPFEVTGGAGLQDGLVDYVSEQIQNNPEIRKQWLVFSPGDARVLRVTTIENAVAAFGATHALVGTITVDGGSVTVAGRLVEAGSGRAVRTFTRSCPLDNEACLQDGLLLAVAGVLDPQTSVPPQPARIASAAFPYYLQGLNYLRRDSVSYDVAIDFFQQAIARDPLAVLPRVALADSYILRFRDTGDRAQLASARAVLDEAAAAHPDLPEVRASLGNLHRWEGRYDAALRELLVAVQADPSNHVFQRMLGDVYDLAERDEEAMAAFEKVIELQPRYWAGYHNYAVFHYRRGRYDEAARLLERLMEWTPDHAQALATLGGVYVAMRRNDEAIEVSRRSCSFVPSRACHVNLGIALQRQRRTEEAIAAYERALSSGTPTAILFLNIADAHAFLGRLDDARLYFRRAVARAEEGLRANVQNSGLRAILAYCLAQVGDDRAEFEMDQALQHSPDDRDVLRYGVLTFETLGQRDRALEILRRSPLPVLEELEASWGTEALRRDPRYEPVAREVRNKERS